MAVINYKGIKGIKKVKQITEEDIMEALSGAAAQSPKTTEVSRAAQNGDVVILDFAGFCEGKQFDGGTSEGYQLELGSGTFIPGFEDQLIGLNAGEEKDVNVTFPTQYTPELAGKDAVFKCKIQKVLEKTDRPLDDEFAKEVFGAPDLEALKAQTKQRMEMQADQEANNETLGNIMDVICENNPRTFEEETVKAETMNIVRAMMVQMTGQEMEPEQFYKLAGMSEQDFTEGLRPTAERNLHVQQMVKEIAEQENIRATEEERMKQAAMMAPQFGMTADQLMSMISPDTFDEDIIMQKVFTLVFENSEITIEA